MATLAGNLRGLRKALAKVQRHKKLVDRLEKRRGFKLQVLKISKKVYEKDPVAQENPMAKLPAEILDNIMQQLPSDADRASMALTCKEHAAHYENLKDKKTAGTNEYWLPRPQRVTDSHRLQLLVRLVPWMPIKYQLCYKCNMFIDKSHPDNDGTWGGNPREVDNLRATIGAMKTGPRCPLCVTVGNMEVMNYHHNFKAYMRLAKCIRRLEKESP